MRRHGIDVLLNTGQPARSTTLQFRTRLPVRSLARPHPRCGQKHIRRYHSSLRPRAAIGRVVGLSPASLLSLDWSRLRSIAVVALRPRRSPATSWARRLRSRHSRFYDLVLRSKDIVGNYNAHSLALPPLRPTHVVLPLTILSRELLRWVPALQQELGNDRTWYGGNLPSPPSIEFVWEARFRFTVTRGQRFVGNVP